MLSRNVHVLVVDDVILMCDFLYGVANKVAGCRAFKALDGKTAAEFLENESIDLLITDIEMRAPSGLELVQRIRAGLFASTSHDIPIIMFSGNAYRDVIEQSITFDVNDFLAKPITSALLSKKIQHHLQHHKAIKPVAHYLQLVADSGAVVSEPPADRGFSVAIVRELPESKADDAEQDGAGSKTAEKKDFLVWPDKATTGYFQLDRRMRNFAFNVSCFHNVFVSNCKPVAIESERKRACEAADYLFHISKNIKNKEQRRDFWLLFQQRLEKLKPHVLELNNINIKHHSQVLVLLKRLSYWWMQTCNRPIIQITDTDNEVADD
ncbi:CheY chemotaxis protein or a CheY-like REC (receiver) domain [Arsukibacterium tuosuense]|uniref:CheY chemotaxis protein or a CheY-like REC (Receiver) domain n=1 Tax=Arsukibacterium tuosuense TaxID=1323745 RepID=A0A285IWY2_9GAMM|nr:response regulator [Arsukibacterium tuosuense]SNY51421.1 CheY chemotaxis protein or a CheY-like REC (receiver) domain [Arsukibacterium tuosuense]